MLVRNCEVNVSLTIRACIESCLYQVLLHRSAWTILVVVEQQQSLWQLAIVQALSLEHILSNSLILAISHQSLDVLTLIFLAFVAKFFLESKVADMVEILLLKVGGRNIIVGIGKCKHVLKHTACGS